MHLMTHYLGRGLKRSDRWDKGMSSAVAETTWSCNVPFIMNRACASTTWHRARIKQTTGALLVFSTLSWASLRYEGGASNGRRLESDDSGLVIGLIAAVLFGVTAVFFCMAGL